MSKNKNKQHRLFVYINCDYMCQSCGLYFEHESNYDGKKALYNGYQFLEIDHIKPLSKGGRDTLENKQALCQRCNNAKADN